ncbi:uncharacterized protein LOC127876438 isoform X2 [Dreissena polymorpha]|uniref:uncharacterized protein LOC127876438 isoform X2 n=1 Tax=Dreissena polymorpha TaxID=45954 RepID=UPI0022652964|nr:uncharacterized protein LOC127876438 isoform X2 [Dreissena polymorpha]
MPKSSQTLKKGVVTEDEVRPTSSGHRSGSQCSVPTGVRSDPQCAFLARCSIVTVYNLEQRLVGVGRDVPDRDAVYTLGRESAQLFRHQTLPRGYTSILAFDPDSKSYHWCALGGTGSSTEVYYVNSRPTSGRCRPFTAGPDRSSISLEQPVSPFQYQKLLALGFRPSTLLLDPDCVYDATSHRACSTHAPRSRKESPQKPDATSGTAARSAVDPQIDAATPDDLACPRPMSCAVTISTGSPQVCTCAVTHHPVVRMPQFSVSGTTKTCVTRRCSTLYRLNVPVQRVQFNPLDIRSSRPGVKSCWVVEFCTSADVEKSIQLGLKWALTCWCFIRTMTSLDAKLRPIETTWRLLTPTQ